MTPAQNENVAGAGAGATSEPEIIKTDLLTEESIEFNDKEVGYDDIGPGLVNVLKLSEVVRSISLRDNKFTLANGHLTSALATNTTLQEFDIGDNEIGFIGAEKLADALKTNKTLTTLKLEGNQIGDEGARAIADALTVNTTLQRLDLCDNLIGDDGLRHLADALKTNQTLLSLELSCNYITRHGVEAIANVLSSNNDDGDGCGGGEGSSNKNTTLQELDLGTNEIGDEGAECLASCIMKNESLVKLWINRNDIGDEGGDKLVKALEANTTDLKQLFFHGNKFATKIYVKLLQCLQGRE